MINGWRQRLGRRLAGKSLAAGVAAGAVGLIVSLATRGVIPGRLLGDPMPLILTVNQLTTGFAYFNWRAPLYHALFAAFLGVLGAAAVWLMDGEGLSRDGARSAGRIAALINVGLVAIRQVDAPIVGLYYLMAAAVSLFITAFIAGKVAQLGSRALASAGYGPAPTVTQEAGRNRLG